MLNTFSASVNAVPPSSNLSTKLYICLRLFCTGSKILDVKIVFWVSLMARHQVSGRHKFRASWKVYHVRRKSFHLRQLPERFFFVTDSMCSNFLLHRLCLQLLVLLILRVHKTAAPHSPHILFRTHAVVGEAWSWGTLSQVWRGVTLY
jgi:hypothetical protein